LFLSPPLTLDFCSVLVLARDCEVVIELAAHSDIGWGDFRELLLLFPVVKDVWPEVAAGPASLDLCRHLVEECDPRLVSLLDTQAPHGNRPEVLPEALLDLDRHPASSRARWRCQVFPTQLFLYHHWHPRRMRGRPRVAREAEGEHEEEVIITGPKHSSRSNLGESMLNVASRGSRRVRTEPESTRSMLRIERTWANRKQNPKCSGVGDGAKIRERSGYRE
jgi:hypothetical protein